jgi:isopentenyl-diphosphate delta-isomerase
LGNNGRRRVATVSPEGEILGSCLILEAHQPPGVLHLAVSVMLRKSDRWVLQQRAADKALFARRWANSCCTHPLPGETPIAAAQRRVFEELGAVVEQLESCGSFVYRATDPDSGLIEHELDHVFVGDISGHLAPNASEISQIVLASDREARALLGGAEGAPWALDVLTLATTSAVA